jgi:hypothetical protein
VDFAVMEKTALRGRFGRLSILSVVSVVERKTYFKLGFLGVTAGPCALSGDEELCFCGTKRNGSRYLPKSASDNPAQSW